MSHLQTPHISGNKDLLGIATWPAREKMEMEIKVAKYVKIKKTKEEEEEEVLQESFS